MLLSTLPLPLPPPARTGPGQSVATAHCAEKKDLMDTASFPACRVRIWTSGNETTGMQSSHTLSLLFEGVAARSCTGVHCSNRQRARRNTERSSATLIYSWIYTLDKTVDPARFAARQEEKSLVSEGEFPLHPHEEFTGRVDQHSTAAGR